MLLRNCDVRVTKLGTEIPRHYLMSKLKQEHPCSHPEAFHEKSVTQKDHICTDKRRFEEILFDRRKVHIII